MALRFLTAGESHGQALVGILEGLPAGLSLSYEDIFAQLRRRKLGFGRGARQQIETDALTILSGVRNGMTLGSPIALLLPNRDWQNWQKTMQVEPNADNDRRLEVPRPGHADLVGGVKYDHTDMRNVLERASARETAMRVALGSIARVFLASIGTHIASRVVRIGTVAQSTRALSSEDVLKLNARTDTSPVRCEDEAVSERMVAEVMAAQARGDTLGGQFEVVAGHLPLGLGSYAHWDRRLEAELGRALLSLNAIKAVEVGMGVEAAATWGSNTHDAYVLNDEQSISYKSNNAGGIEGGMSTGQPLVIRCSMKPLSTLKAALASVHKSERRAQSAHHERSDVCAVPAAGVIGEALVALVLAQAVLEKFGGDSMRELCGRIEAWRRHTSVL